MILLSHRSDLRTVRLVTELPDGLVDLIYDAATEEELWTPALVQIADLTGSLGGLIFGIDNREHFVAFSHNGRMSEEANRAYRERHFVNPWWDYMHTVPAGRYVQSEDIVPLHELKRSPFFHEVLRPQNMSHNFMVPLATRPDFQVGFNLCRSESQGRLHEDGIKLFTRLHSHLKRSLLLGFRLDGYRALQRAEFKVLDRLFAGIILLDRSAKIIFANAAANALSRDNGPFRFRKSVVTAASSRHAQRLETMIQDALLGAAVSSMSVPHPEDGRMLTVLVSSLRSRDLDRFSDLHLKDAAAFLFIVDPANRAVIPLDWIMDAYGLTQAEARVAVAASAGTSISETSMQLGLSPNTVKTHLRKVFGKTGVSRQAELGRLVTAIGQLKNERSDPGEGN